MKILITGATGFVGKNLVGYFKEDGFDVFAPTEYELDLTNSEKVVEYLDKHMFDVIVHSATILRAGTVYPADVCELNLKMFFNLIRGISGKTKIINLGSGSEYSRKYWHKKMHEDFFDKYVPEDGHSYAKYIISKYIIDNESLNAVTLRIFGIFGRYEDYRFKFISNSIAKNIMNMPITINQNVVYDYLYVYDFYKMLRHFVNNAVKYRSYNITPTRSIDLLEIAETVNLVSGRDSEIVVVNDGIGVEYSGDNDRLIEEIGGDLSSPIEDTVMDLYKYYNSGKVDISKEELEDDVFLKYAKNLKNDYFDKNK